MNTLIQADIFFFITTIAVIVLTIILSVAIYHAIFVLRDARHISRKLSHTVDELEEDLEKLRLKVGEEGQKAKYLVDFFFNKLLGKRKPAAPRLPREKPESKEVK